MVETNSKSDQDRDQVIGIKRVQAHARACVGVRKSVQAFSAFKSTVIVCLFRHFHIQKLNALVRVRRPGGIAFRFAMKHEVLCGRISRKKREVR